MNLNIINLGRMNYKKALHIQRTLQDKRIAGEIENTFLIVEHPPVITLGKRGEMDHIKASTDQLGAEGFDIVNVERGGDVTYHGPGQMVGYPIIHLRESDIPIRAFIDQMQDVFISYLDNEFGITAHKRSGTYTGVWVGNSKITAIGISVKRAVTLHGFAFNVNTNLNHFGYIVPCGLTDCSVTSLQQLLGEPVDFKDTCDAIAARFCEIYGMKPVHVSLERFLEEHNL